LGSYLLLVRRLQVRPNQRDRERGWGPRYEEDLAQEEKEVEIWRRKPGTRNEQSLTPDINSKE